MCFLADLILLITYTLYFIDLSCSKCPVGCEQQDLHTHYQQGKPHKEVFPVWTCEERFKRVDVPTHSHALETLALHWRPGGEWRMRWVLVTQWRVKKRVKDMKEPKEGVQISKPHLDALMWWITTFNICLSACDHQHRSLSNDWTKTFLSKQGMFSEHFGKVLSKL